MSEIRQKVAAAQKDEWVVGKVLTGAGRGFCPGMDMKALDFPSSGRDRAQDYLSGLSADPGDPNMGENFRVAHNYLMSVRKPITDALNETYAGLGYTIATSADLRIV